MLLVQPVTALRHSHEKLGAILVSLAIVGHSNDTSVGEVESLVKLVKEWFPIDAVATSACPRGVTSLHHEVFDYTMEHGPVVVPFQAELDEVAAGSRRLACPKVDLELSVIGLQHHLG